MGSELHPLKSLQRSKDTATDLLNMIRDNATYEDLDKKYKQLQVAKNPLYKETLFMEVDTILGLSGSERITDLDEKRIRSQIEFIDLATFAYHVLRQREYNTCVNSYFKTALPYYEKYTTEEITLYLNMRLYLLRRSMNQKGLNGNVSELIDKFFPKDPYSCFFKRDTEGKRQTMKAMHYISNFLHSKVEDLTTELMFGGVTVVDTLLRDLIEYRMRVIGNNTLIETNGREGDEVYPFSRNEISDLVDTIFKPDTIMNAKMKEDELEDERMEKAERTDSEEISNESDTDNSNESLPEELDEQQLDNNKDNVDICDIEVVSTIKTNEENELDEIVNFDEDNTRKDDSDIKSTIASVKQTKERQFVSTARARITDAQPNAHVLTAEDADFQRTEAIQPHKNLFKYFRSENNPVYETNTHQSQSGHSSTVVVPEDSSGDRGSLHREREESMELPEGYYFDEKTKKKRKIAKTRERTLRWTPEEVQALEDGLYAIKKRAWASILSLYKSRLGEHTQTQLKDKAVNELKRRKKLNIPLGGFYYAEHPVNY